MNRFGDAWRYARRAETLTPSVIREMLKTTESPGVISFAGGLPAPELFPAEAIGAITARLLAEDPAGALQYGTTEGYGPLREQVSDRFRALGGPRAGPKSVLVTTGSQQALHLISRVLLEPGDVVLVEDPSYLGALQAFAASEAQVVAVPGGERGVSPDALDKSIAESATRPKLLYLVPNFHNPTGATLDADRRRDLARVAEAAGVPVLEDDPYGALRYDGPAVPPMVGHLTSSNWAHLGTASKTLAPGLRVGWLVTPDADLMRRLVAAKQAVDLHTSTLNQRIVAAFLDDDKAYDAHLARLLCVYRERRDVMAAAVREQFPADCQCTFPAGGLFLWARLPERFDVDWLFGEAIGYRVAFVPGSAFGSSASTRQGMRLNFSNASPEKIREGIRRLGELLRKHERSSG